MNYLPQHLKAFRQRHALTQRALALLLNVNESTIYEWERGNHPGSNLRVIVEEALKRLKPPPPLECLRCGRRWRSHSETPSECPTCRSPYWDRPKGVPMHELVTKESPTTLSLAAVP